VQLFVDHDPSGPERLWQAGSVQPTRRQVLLASGIATAGACVSACTADKPLRPTVPSRQDRLRAEAVAREQALVDAYTASLAQHPAQRVLLTAILGDHTAHLAALQGPASTPTATPTPAALPPAFSLAQLTALEKQAARQHADAAGQADADCDDGSLLLLLSSLAACEASHAVLL
jgi:hypothetical protein